MDEYLIVGGTLVTLDEACPIIDDGALLIKDGCIADIGTTKELKNRYLAARVAMDAAGKVVLPGFICAHHHLYSSMARGFAPPGEPAQTFGQILERLWWKLDRALTPDDVRLSALIALGECIRNGTTTILDHHASPSCRDGSLDILADAVLESGIRASLCYEVSDRNEAGAGVSENRRFLERLERDPSRHLSAMVGIHASFTVSDRTLAACREVGERFGVGYHIHVAEGIEDPEHATARHNMRTVERLVKHGICGERSLFIHCININDAEMDLLAQTRTPCVHNPESNMNNAVGVARVLELLERGVLVGLGTDGMSSDMLSQMRCAFLAQRLDRRDPRVAFCEAPQLLLSGNRAIAARHFPKVTLGVLQQGAAADLAVLDYAPPTPLVPETFLGHLLFGMVDATVDSTVAGGRILMQDGQIRSLDVARIAAQARQAAPALWERIRAQAPTS